MNDGRDLVLPVTVAATRRPAPGKSADLQTWAARLTAAAADRPGFHSSRVDSGPAGVTTTLVFEDAASLAGWERCPERAALIAEAVPLTEVTLSPPRPPATPPRWRTAAIVWAGLFPFSALYGLLVGPLVTDLPVVLQSLASSVVLVPLAVFVGIPAVTAILRRMS